MSPTPAPATLLLPALGQRLHKLLEDAVAGGPSHTPGVRSTTPRELAHGSAEGLTLTLLGVRDVPGLRLAVPPVASAGERAAPPLPIEAHYLVTAWATQSAVQQWLLAAALRQVHQHPVIAASELAHPFSAGAPLGTDPGASYRLLPRFPDPTETAAIAAVIGAEALPASFVVVAGPLLLD